MEDTKLMIAYPIEKEVLLPKGFIPVDRENLLERVAQAAKDQPNVDVRGWEFKRLEAWVEDEVWEYLQAFIPMPAMAEWQDWVNELVFDGIVHPITKELRMQNIEAFRNSYVDEALCQDALDASDERCIEDLDNCIG